MLTKIVMELYDINPFRTGVSWYVPPPQVILPIFVIMYIVVNRYSKKCAFNRIGLKKKLNACRTGGVLSGGRVWGSAGPELEC